MSKTAQYKLVHNCNCEIRAKHLLSQDVLKNIKDQSIQNILRTIIFDPKNIINWDNALKEIHKHMPELYKNYTIV